MRRYLQEYFFVLGPARQRLPALLLMMLAIASLDVVGLGLILPLISLIAGGSSLAASGISGFDALLDLVDAQLLALIVLAVFVIKAFAGYAMQRRLVQFSERHRSHLMLRLLAAYLAQPYEYHLNRNSSEMVSENIHTTAVYSTGTFIASLKLVSDGLMFLAVIGFLAWVAWQAVVIAAVLFVVLMGAYGIVMRGELSRLGSLVGQSTASIGQVVNQSLGAVREVRILGVEDYCLAQLKIHANRCAEANASLGALTTLPKYLIECSLVALLLALALLVFWQRVHTPTLVPILGLFAVAAIRLMPGVTSVISSISNLRVSRYALAQLAQVLAALKENASARMKKAVPVGLAKSHAPFRELRFNGVSYAYPDTTAPAVRDLCFSIEAGQAVGIVGRSGCGKSTLADILLGLLVPQQGCVLVDGLDISADINAWMGRLAYIPQVIYLTDDTLRRNIAFGVDDVDIDSGKLEVAVRAARLEEVIRNLPAGLETMVGERGTRLSGGQRQRVALARAFYHDRELIVMDEATASLDYETEQEVVAAIRTLQGRKTLVIIAHKVSTLEGCDLILRMEDGRIAEVGDIGSAVRASAANHAR